MKYRRSGLGEIVRHLELSERHYFYAFIFILSFFIPKKKKKKKKQAKEVKEEAKEERMYIRENHLSLTPSIFLQALPNVFSDNPVFDGRFIFTFPDTFVFLFKHTEAEIIVGIRYMRKSIVRAVAVTHMVGLYIVEREKDKGKGKSPPRTSQKINK